MNTTPEDLSERWSIIIAQEKITMKATAQRLKRSGVLPLSGIYGAERMVVVKQLDCIMATDKMHTKNKSIGIRLIHKRLWGTRAADLRRRQGTSVTKDRIPN